MTRTRALSMTAIILIVIAFLIGYWPQRQSRIAAERELVAVSDRLAEVEDRMAIAGLLGQLLMVRDMVAAQNYGSSAQLSSAFFNAVREHAGRTRRPGMAAVLQNILNQRDLVTSALARGDAAVAGTLRQMEMDLRNGLGFEVPTDATPR
jgi:hypothetical protein